MDDRIPIHADIIKNFAVCMANHLTIITDTFHVAIIVYNYKLHENLWLCTSLIPMIKVRNLLILPC